MNTKLNNSAAWRRYQQLLEDRSDLFTNSNEEGIKILLEEAEIAAACEAVASRSGCSTIFTECAQVGVVYTSRYFIVVNDAVRFPSGQLGLYLRCVPNPDLDPGSVIFALYCGQVVLLHHFRHATRRWHLECPRGFRQPGSTPEETARAELKEELGAVPKKLIALGMMHPNTGLSAEAAELFFAELESIGDVERAAGISGIRLVDINEFEGLVASGGITDNFTVAAFARARLHGFI